MSIAEPAETHQLAEQFRQGPPSDLPHNWENDERYIEAHQLLARDFLANLPECPNHFHGRGIVICAGGIRLFTNAWVCIKILREHGCDLPIQLWYLGEGEMDQAMREIVAEHNVECVDARAIGAIESTRKLNGWELKPFAMLHCPFHEVMLLDADNVPTENPEYLFETDLFQQHGAIFWPDYGRLEPFRQIWNACEVEYVDEPEFESGQILVDKTRCWEALNLTSHYNQHSDFYYLHIHGDKETFHLAFRRVEKSYAMPDRGIYSLDATMCQHDFEGKRIFQHRNMDKWRLDGTNRQIDGFLHEDTCREYLAELRTKWTGQILWNEPMSTMESHLVASLAGRRYEYERVGYDIRTIELQQDRTVGEGSADMERMWTVTMENNSPMIVIHGKDGPTCSLRPRNGSWYGQWFRFEQMPIKLTPIAE